MSLWGCEPDNVKCHINFLRSHRKVVEDLERDQAFCSSFKTPCPSKLILNSLNVGFFPMLVTEKISCVYGKTISMQFMAFQKFHAFFIRNEKFCHISERLGSYYKVKVERVCICLYQEFKRI